MTMDKISNILERFMKLNPARKEEFISYISTTLGIIEQLNKFDERVKALNEKLEVTCENRK